MSFTLVAGHAYENVYLMSADAAGHSNIVASNPRDRVTRAFDLLEERVTSRIKTVSDSHRCGYAKLWHWHGDGGLIVFHDEHETTSRDTALDTARMLVTQDLRFLAGEFEQLDIEGELHLRVAVHKGTITYRGEGAEGAIRSPDINFVVHLEAAAPPDTVAISEEVFRTAGARYAADYHPVGRLEGHRVYLATSPDSEQGASRAWIRSHGVGQHTAVFGFSERPSQEAQVRLLDTAGEDVVEIGTALHTNSDFLVTTQRPDLYRQATLRFLERGGVYRCYLMDPDAEETRRVAEERGEDLALKIRNSLHAFGRFRATLGSRQDQFQVYQLPRYPGVTILGFDIASSTGMIMYSHYLPTVHPASPLERGDMPHYLTSRDSGALYESIRHFAEEATGAPGVRRVL